MMGIKAYEIYGFIADGIKYNEVDLLLSERFRDALKYNISCKLPNSLILYTTLLARYIGLVGGVGKIQPHNLTTQEDHKILLHRYQSDPSDFYIMFLYATTCLLSGERSRACQLYDRLMRTKWAHKHLAATMMNAIGSDESHGKRP